MNSTQRRILAWTVAAVGLGITATIAAHVQVNYWGEFLIELERPHSPFLLSSNSVVWTIGFAVIGAIEYYIYRDVDR